VSRAEGEEELGAAEEGPPRSRFGRANRGAEVDILKA